jgi:excisionase family DNA binding protein
MKDIYISTREVASLLSVTETTVKRWTNSKRLNCVKTLGGHRKYLLKDIEDFTKENRIPISGITAPKTQPDKVGYALYSKNMDQIIEVVLEEATKGNRDGLFDLFMYLTKNGIRFINLVDEIICPALEKIGYLWEKNQLKVEDEHLASDTIKTALSRLIVHLPRQKNKNIKVLCACIESEFHDIGIQSLAYELELSGYILHYLGANTPFQSIDMTIKKEKPSYSFISATSPAISEEEFIKCIKRTGKICKENNSKLILGGRYLQKFDKTFLASYAIAGSIKEAKSFITN